MNSIIDYLSIKMICLCLLMTVNSCFLYGFYTFYDFYIKNKLKLKNQKHNLKI